MKQIRIITGALITALACLTACSGTDEGSVITGEPAVQEQTSEASASETGSTLSAAEDFGQVYYSYADTLRENRDAIKSYEDARDSAGGTDVSDAVAAVCDVTQDGMPELIFIAKDEDADSYSINIYTHVGNQNRRIGYIPAWGGTSDTTFCAFQDSDSADFCIFTGGRADSDRVYTYAQYELSGSDLSAVTTITKTEGNPVTYTMNGHDAGESDFYRQREKFIDGVHGIFLRSARGFDGEPWNTFVGADSLGMNYDDIMYYLDHTYVPQEDKDESSTEGQIFPDSGSRYIFNDDLKDLSESDIRKAINEIYARHGVKFDDSSVTDFFSAYSWYKAQTPEDEFDENTLNDYERANISFMEQYLRTKEAAEREASEEAARIASEAAAKQASQEAARKASEEAAREASQKAAKEASEKAAKEASEKASQESSQKQPQRQSVSLSTALSRLQGAVGTSINGHTLQYEFTATVNDSSGRQYYAFTVTRMEGGAWVFYRNYLVAVDGTGYAADSSQSGRPSYSHGSVVSAGALQGF